MDAKEISELYARMVGACRKEGSEAERGAWKEVLGGYSYSDVDAACRRWVADTTVEQWTGKPIGSRMPSPAEIKVSIGTFDRKSAASYRSCGQCEEGWIRVFTGQTAGGKLIDSRVGAVKRCGCFVEWASTRKRA